MLDRKKLFTDRRAVLGLGCAAFFAGVALFVSVSSSGAAGSTSAARGVQRFGGASADPSVQARDAFRIDRDWRLGGTSWRAAGGEPGTEEPVDDEPVGPDEEAEGEGEPMAGKIQGLDFAVSR